MHPMSGPLKARGIPLRARLLRHAAPNAAIPLVTLIGLSLGSLIAGSVVTEQVFAWPGVGQLLVRSVATRDIAMVQFLVLAVATTMVMANLIVDLLYLVIDPRIRRSSGSVIRPIGTKSDTSQRQSRARIFDRVRGLCPVRTCPDRAWVPRHVSLRSP